MTYTYKPIGPDCVLRSDGMEFRPNAKKEWAEYLEVGPLWEPEPEPAWRLHEVVGAEQDEYLIETAARRALAMLKQASDPPPQDRTVPEETPQQLPPDPESARLSEYGPVGSSVPPEIRELMEEGETIAQAKTRITQLLWVEQAELRQLQGKKGENPKREEEIEFLLGLLARLSD